MADGSGVKYNARAAKEVRYPSISPRVLDFDHVNGPEIIALDPTKYKLEDLVVTLVYYNSGFEDVQVLLLPPVSGNCRMDYENEVGSYCRPVVVKRDDDEISLKIGSDHIDNWLDFQRFLMIRWQIRHKEPKDDEFGVLWEVSKYGIGWIAGIDGAQKVAAEECSLTMMKVFVLHKIAEIKDGAGDT